MTNYKIFKLALQISARVLCIDIPEYCLAEKALLPLNISATYLPVGNIIIFNNDWLEKAEFVEALIVAFHEMRHVYQRRHISLLDKPQFREEALDTVYVWKREFNQYHTQ